jgi:hypothetical protein
MTALTRNESSSSRNGLKNFMPPRKYKVNHHKDKGSSFAGFIERNAEVLPEHMLKKKKQPYPIKEDSDESSGESESVKDAITKPDARAPKVQEKSNADSSDDDVDSALSKEFGRLGGPVGESRREREARQAEEARKRYQELHLAGKTAEAKADMARLAEIRRKREEAAAKAQQMKDEKEAARTRGRRPTNPNADVAREAFM